MQFRCTINPLYKRLQVLPELPLPDGGDPPALAVQDMEFDGRLDEDWKDVTVKVLLIAGDTYSAHEMLRQDSFLSLSAGMLGLQQQDRYAGQVRHAAAAQSA